MTRVLVLNGPNLNLLGEREPEIYGHTTLAKINGEIETLAGQLGLEVDFVQSNHEGVLIDQIQAAPGKYGWVIFNPGALSHYSYACHDALKAVNVPCIEVHLSNIQAREEFRSRSVIAPACQGQIAGFGSQSYLLALYAIFESRGRVNG